MKKKKSVLFHSFPSCHGMGIIRLHYNIYNLRCVKNTIWRSWGARDVNLKQTSTTLSILPNQRRFTWISSVWACVYSLNPLYILWVFICADFQIVFFFHERSFYPLTRIFDFYFFLGAGHKINNFFGYFVLSEVTTLILLRIFVLQLWSWQLGCSLFILGVLVMFNMVAFYSLISDESGDFLLLFSDYLGPDRCQSKSKASSASKCLTLVEETSSYSTIEIYYRKG